MSATILQQVSDTTHPQPGRFSNDTLAPTAGSGALLCQMFPYRWTWIEALNTVNRPQWRTETRYGLSPFQLWDKWSDPALLVGVSFGPKTAYGLLDIDARSPYHGDLRPITDALEDIGINATVLVQSSNRGGHHLYYFLPQAVSSFELACVVRWALHRAGMEIKDGHIEQFPNTKAYDAQFKAHRLPLQPDGGSYLLDKDGVPYCDRISELHRLAQATAQAQDVETLLEAMPAAKSWWKAKQRRSAKVEASLAAWRRDLETAMLEGWTGPGQTNELLGKIATYGRVFLAYEGRTLADYVRRTAEDCPGYRRWCSHIREMARKAWDWAKSAMHRYWALGTPKTEDKPTVNTNDLRKLAARQKIAAAVDKLAAAGELPDGISERAAAIRREAPTSMATLYKNCDVWHPGRLSETTGEKVGNTPSGEADSDSEAPLNDEPESVADSPDGVSTHPASNEGYAGLKMAVSHSDPCPGGKPPFEPSPPSPGATAAAGPPDLRRQVSALRNRYTVAMWAGNRRQMEQVKQELAELGLHPETVLSPGWNGNLRASISFANVL